MFLKDNLILGSDIKFNINSYTSLSGITANLNKVLHSASSTPYDTGRVWLNGATIMRIDFCIVINNTSDEYITRQVMFSDINVNLGDVNIINTYAAAYYGNYTSGSDINMSNIDGIQITYDNMAIYFPDNLSSEYSSLYVVGFAEYTKNFTLPNANITKIFSE